jgi:hypothetical protein
VFAVPFSARFVRAWGHGGASGAAALAEAHRLVVPAVRAMAGWAVSRLRSGLLENYPRFNDHYAW